MSETGPSDPSDPITDEEGPMPEDTEPSADEPSSALPGVGELFRKALLAGVGAVFMTEEGIRKTVTDLKLPKEAFAYLAGQAERTRTEATRILRKEVRRFLNSDAFKEQLAGLVSGLTLEVKAEIRLRPDARPDVAAKLKVKQSPTDAAPGGQGT
jgi:hypothetical protein